MQYSLIIEHDQVAVGEPEPHLKSRIAQNGRESPVGRIKGLTVVRGPLQRCDRSAVVVYGGDFPAARQLNHRPFRVQFCVARSIMKRYRSLRQEREGIGI